MKGQGRQKKDENKESTEAGDTPGTCFGCGEPGRRRRDYPLRDSEPKLDTKQTKPAISTADSSPVTSRMSSKTAASSNSVPQIVESDVGNVMIEESEEATRSDSDLNERLKALCLVY